MVSYDEILTFISNTKNAGALILWDMTGDDHARAIMAVRPAYGTATIKP